MQQNYQDAMAIVAKYGKPDLFVTYTCNPKIKDIVENLRDGECAEDRPNLVSRVRNPQGHQGPPHFGSARKFQKRGLPHCHMLIILRGEDKLHTRDDIDRLISAEIPDPDGRLGAVQPGQVMYDTWTLWCAETQQCLHGGWRVQEEVPRRNNGRTVQTGGFVAARSPSYSTILLVAMKRSST